MEGESRSIREFAAGPETVERVAAVPTIDTVARHVVEAPSAIPIGHSIAQAKLSVGPADDPFEREADQVATRVVRALQSGAAVPRADAAASARDEGRVRRCAAAPRAPIGAVAIRRIQRAAVIGTAGGELDDDTSRLLRSTRSSGRPMDDVSRTRMEGAFGADFSRVRVHSNAVSTELNNRIQAKAFTTGNDIYFRDGLPDTSSSGGQELLAHELTHTIQQSAGPRRMRRVIDVAALRQSAKDANGKLSRFKKSSMEPVFKAAESYNAAPTPVELARVKYAIDCVEQDKYDKYQATAQALETNMKADLIAFIGQPAHWAQSAPTLRDPSWFDGLEGLFELCGSGLMRGKLLYRLGGDAAWKENAMTQFTISQNDFREALANLGVFEAGTAGHKGAAEVDGLIAEKLASFVQNNLQNRGRIEGRLAVVGAEDWEVIGRQQYGEAVWNGGKRRTLNAFVDRSSDPPRVFVNKDRGNAGTAIHEACHMWGDPARPINRISHDLNEGITEYFARKICSSLTPPIARTVYAKQFNIANKLVQTIGEDVVGAAFFDGLVGGMSAAFGATRWANFVTHVNAGDYARAETVLQKVARQADDEVDEAEVGASIAEMFGADA